MKIFVIRFIFGVLGFLTSCSKVPVESTSKLIYGREAKAGEFDSTIMFQGCTGVVISDRLILTAAHCFTLALANPISRVGEELSITNAKRLTKDVVEQWIMIKEIHLHPNSAVKFNGDHIINDLAIIETKEPIENIPAAKISYETLSGNEEVWMTGGGCERDSKLNLTEDRRLKLGKQTLLKPQTLIEKFNDPKIAARFDPDNLKFYIDDLSRYQDTYSFVEGEFELTIGSKPSDGEEKSAILCPGDSGGPLYRADTKEPTVIGINATRVISYIDDKIVYQTFSRLDLIAKNSPGTWIKKILKQKR